MKLPGRTLSRLADPLLRRIAVDESWLRLVEQAAARGPVVHVLRNVSALDYLALGHLCERFTLPRIGFVNEVGEMLGPAPPPETSTPAEALCRTLGTGMAAALFLKRAPQGSLVQRGRAAGDELIVALLELQRGEPDREVMLIPQSFVWTQRPERRRFSLVDALFGPADFPGELRQAAQFLLNYSNCQLRAGEPVSLRDFLARPSGAEPVATQVRRLTYALLRRVERERRTIVGPAHQVPDRVREQVLRSPRLQRVIGELAGPDPTQRRLLEDKARGMLRRLQTIPDPETLQSVALLVGQVFDRVYAGIDVDQDGLDRLRAAAKEGSVVLLPSHKSHVDYLLLSYELRRRSIQAPVIAAGDNLSFFPIGPVLRRSGAFFIRRRFRGDRLYAAVVDAYVRRLLRESWMLELFLEGGRSRTGKVLAPQLGLLGMVVAAALGLERHRVFFMPVSIGYERLMEEGAYARELSGGDKKREDLGQLLGLHRVLSERWGRVNIQFGRVIEIGDLGVDLGVTSQGEVSPPVRRAIVKRLAHQVMNEINRVTALTPGTLVAMVLLCRGRRGVSYRELVDHCRRLTRHCRASGARATPSLVAPGASELREQGVREALRLYVKSRLVEQHLPGDTLTAEDRPRSTLLTGSDVIFTVPDNKRLRLDLAKNHIIHLFVDRALLSTALLCRPDAGVAPPGPSLARDALRDRVQSLSRLFKLEFMFRADAPFDRIFDDLVTAMVADGEIRIEGSAVALGPGHDDLDGRGWVGFYANVLRNFLEGYLVAARSLRLLVKGPMARKDLLGRALRTGERMFLKGEIERAEAVSRPILDNALGAFVEQGYLIAQADRLALAESFQSEQGVVAVEARLKAFLRRRDDDETGS